MSSAGPDIRCGRHVIRDDELQENFIRSAGPGGQNVNKVSTAVQLRFDAAASSLEERVRERLIRLAGSRATKDGVIVMHISNKYFDLRRILARTAAEVGLQTWTRLDMSDEPMEKRMRTSSLVVAMARDGAQLGPMATSGRWTKLEPSADVTPWTDDYSNILAAVREKMSH